MPQGGDLVGHARQAGGVCADPTNRDADMGGMIDIPNSDRTEDLSRI